MDEITIAIPMTPVAKGRPRMTRAGFAYTPAKTRSAEATIKQYCQMAIGNRPYPLFGEDAVKVAIVFTFDRPKSRKNEIYKTSRPDLDNLAKIVDACNGILWRDDSQVVCLTASKVWGDCPSITMTVWRLENGPKRMARKKA